MKTQEKAKYEFYGSCAPGNPFVVGNSTFSVGIYEVVPKTSGKGTKRGAVVVRVGGPVSDPEKVYEKAREIVEMLESEGYVGPKNVRVK